MRHHDGALLVGGVVRDGAHEIKGQTVAGEIQNLHPAEVNHFLSTVPNQSQKGNYHRIPTGKTNAGQPQ